MENEQKLVVELSRSKDFLKEFDQNWGKEQAETRVSFHIGHSCCDE